MAKALGEAQSRTQDLGKAVPVIMQQQEMWSIGFQAKAAASSATHTAAIQLQGQEFMDELQAQEERLRKEMQVRLLCVSYVMWC